jgi:rhomboid protease GluP
MTDAQDNPAVPAHLAAMLVRVQQMLLAAGYRYVAGNAEEWPFTPVLLTREGDLLYVLPLRRERAEEDVRIWEAARRKGGTSAGLILVGTLDPGDRCVRRFYDSTQGAVAYIDAAGGAFTLRRKWSMGTTLRPLTRRSLRKFLRPRPDPKSLAIDCRAKLQGALADLEQEAAFYQQARRTGQITSPTLTHLVTAGLAVVFVAMVAASREWKTILDPSRKVLMDWGALYGPAVRAGQWWRIVTCGMVHVGLIHLVFNLMALYIFGGVLEMLQGRWRLGVLLVWSVACGSLARLNWGPMILSAGASGGIFGLIGALLAVVIRHRKSFPPALAKSYRKWLVTVLLYNAVFLIDPRIDSVAHAGGFLGGLAMGLVLCRSPVKVSWPALWTWPALAALVLGACLFGQQAIRKIPAAGFERVEAQDQRERQATLAEMARLVKSFEEGPEKLNKAFYDAMKAPSVSERKRIFGKIQGEILPTVGDADVAAKLRDLAARVQTQKHPLADSVSSLLLLREQYLDAVVAAIGRPQSSDYRPVLQAWNRVLNAQVQVELEIALLEMEAGLGPRGR